MTAPIGYFVHHQGRGHAERCAALVNALPHARPVTIFCARDDIFPPLRDGVEVVRLPSLFEPTGAERPADWVATPETLHCAPLGWPGIREAMATLARWFHEADPALIVCDVSAEIAQLARICSVPHVKVLQHGRRDDAGHMAAYDGAAGLLVPCDERLAQPDWTEAMRAKAHFAPGLGVDTALPDRHAARARLGLDPDERIFLVISGAGGSGLSSAPLGVGARTFPETRWVTLGRVDRDRFATEPANLHHMGWVEDVPDWLAVCDVVVSSTGNTTVQQVLASGKPWIAVPEWRFFDEQVEKARALAAAGVALHLPHMPSSAQAWRDALGGVGEGELESARRRSMVNDTAAGAAAAWLEGIALRLRASAPHSPPENVMNDARPSTSVLTLARGRAGHLRNFVLGLTRQTQQPDELVVGVMQDDLYDDLPETDFPIRQLRIEGEALPLARARNAVGDAAAGEVLIFLDVDCIAEPSLVADYAGQAASGEGLMMGEVLYLPAGAAEDGWTYEAFERVAVRHSDRQAGPAEGRRRCEDYRCFWSLTFAMHRDDWKKSGGLDERYEGYGGEDTDYGKTLDAKGIPIWWIAGARAYHQHHAHCMPPIHHVASIVRNAEIFADKWGYRTMEHWLHAFRMMGLVEFTRSGIRILREPNQTDFALCSQKDDMPYAATGPVVRKLEDMERARRGLPPLEMSLEERHAQMTAAQEQLLARPSAAAASHAAE